ncbi:MAG: hypothetical protein U0L52_04185, partial [Bacteroidaceae bacterium]|nr:hypothetical protein [Bacteroidaceae bacterium]
VIQWLEESEVARVNYQYWLWRANLAKLGKPCKNLYQQELDSNLEKITDIEKRESYKKHCIKVPEGSSFALKKAVDNRANQMACGVDAYEYQVYDPYNIIKPDTADLLAAQCQQDYVQNKLNVMSATFSRDLTWAGVAAVLIKYDPISDKNKVMRINPKNIWFDTKYSSLGVERFRGYSTMISWKKLKKMIADDKDEEVNLDIKAPDRSITREEEKDAKKYWGIDKTAKYNNRKIRTLNGLDIYVEDLNRLAASPQLGGLNYFYEYDHDLHTCYNLNWYRTYASDPVKRTKSQYNGDDVELTVIYDLDKKIEYKVINRRYVISANSKAFRRKIAFTITNPITGEQKERLDDFCLDCPLKFQFEEQENMDSFPHPWAPVFSLLDTHDEVCAWRAKREHVSKILSILRIETNGADAVSLRGVLNIMGIVLDDIQGDINSINFQYSYDPIDSEIAFRENRIQQLLHAYDQFDALQAMGDRASAAESGMAVGAIAQGLSTHQNAIMQLYADIARQCIANRVAYSPSQEFPIVTLGQERALTLQEMALDAIINVKPALAAKVAERTIAANAMQVLASFSGRLSKPLEAYLMEKAMLGIMPKGFAESGILDQGANPQEIALAQQQAQNDAQMLAQNQQAYEQNPVEYETDDVMATQDSDSIDEIISGLNAGGDNYVDYQDMSADATMSGVGPESLDMMSQEGATTAGAIQGMTPESGGMYANPNGEL